MSQHHHEKLFIDGPAGNLQAIYQAGDSDKAAIVVCLHTPGLVVPCATRWSIGLHVRLNFRGVDQSEGIWDEGDGEADDVAAALDWMHEKHPDVPIWLAGFSFGCYAGLKAAVDDERVERMFAVAPAVNLWDFSFMRSETRPVKVVHGTADELVPHEMVSAWVKLLDSVDYSEIEGVGHFFPDHSRELQSELLSNL